MMAVADCSSCNFSHCHCRWRGLWSPETPLVVPGDDYAFLPDDDDADRDPAFSVVVGAVSKFDGDSSLRLHRLRVARSGRVLRRSGDALEVLAGDVDFKPKNTWSQIRAANAARSPDGRSLSVCLFSRDLDLSDLKKPAECPRPLQLHMDNLGGGGAAAAAATTARITVSPLPGLTLGPLMPTCPISAAGELWAPYLTKLDGPCRLVMLRLDMDAGRWVEVADLDLPHGREGAHWRDPDTSVFQGFAVIGHIILLSLYPPHLFFTFDCSTHAWASVITSKDQCTQYIPLQESSVYVEEDDTIYFISAGSGRLYAYKLCRDDQVRHQHLMAPPAMVDSISVCPSGLHGNGFLTHLGGRVMCSVWIGEKLSCNCDAKLVLITTFRVMGDDPAEFFAPKKVDVLHSTCRRLGMWPSKQVSYFEFRFLQKYEELNRDNATPAGENNTGNTMAESMYLEAMAIPPSSNVVKPSKMLACCREFMNGTPFSSAVMLDCSDVQTRNSLYIICQVASHSAVYKINTLNGRLTSCHDKILAPHCIMDNMRDHEDDLKNQPLPWHFVCVSEYIYAVPYIGNEIYACCLHQGTLYHFPARRPIDDDFSIALVLQVGQKTIAIGNTLQGVYHLSRANEWTHLSTHGLPDLEKKVNLSGYVVLSNESCMVSDADTNCCFLLNLQLNRWSIVMPFVEFTRSLKYQRELLPSCRPGRAFLSERSVFIKGFIYTCSDGGLAAYELVEQDDSYYLGDRIDLKFLWIKCWERGRMCFDCVGEDAQSGTIMFFVLQGDYVRRPGYPNNHYPICTTVVQVKTERMHNGKLKPKTIGHVDIGRSSIEWDGGGGWRNRVIWTRSCFAAASF